MAWYEYAGTALAIIVGLFVMIIAGDKGTRYKSGYNQTYFDDIVDNPRRKRRR